MSKSRSNTHTVKLADGREVLYSYGVAVAAFVPMSSDAAQRQPIPSEVAGYVALDHSFSVTTSKHVNQFTERRAVRVPPARFVELIAPLDANLPSGVL